MQQLATRPLMTAGVALAGVGGMIAATPLPAAPPSAPEIDFRDVQLTAGVELDLLGSFQGFFNDASDNAATLTQNFFLAPGVGLQQAIVNQVGFFDQVINDPSQIGDVLSQFGGNVKDVLTGLTLIGASDTVTDAALAHTTDGLHQTALSLIPGMLPDDLSPQLSAVIDQLLNFAASPVSGILVGAAGPFVSPIVPFINPFMGVLGGADPAESLQDLLSAPLKAVNGFFNGATLDLDPVASLLTQAGILPDEGLTVDGINYAFGGLFSSGSVETTYKLGDITINAAGGSILNGLGIDALGFSVPGQGVGPIGALEGMSQAISSILGSGWDGKDAVPIPPLAGLEAPQFDDLLSSFNPSSFLESLNFADFNVGDLGELIMPSGILAALGDAGGSLGTLFAIPEALIAALLGAMPF